MTHAPHRHPPRRTWLRALGSRAAAWACVAVLASASATAAPLVLPAAPAGTNWQDAWTRAMEEVARLSSAGWPAEGVVVELPAGMTRLEAPLRIGPRQSGREGAPLVIRGSRQGASVLSGTVAVGTGSAQQPGATPDGSIVDARVRRYELPAGLAEGLGRIIGQGQGREARPAPSEPLSAGRAMNLAAWPASGFARVAVVSPPDRYTLDPTLALPRDVAGPPSLLMHGYWGEDWADEWLDVGMADAAQRQFKFNGGSPLKGVKPGARLRIMNLLSQVDQPGEWFETPDGRALYAIAWGPDTALELTRLENAIVIEGASHVRLEGFTVQGVRGDAIVVTGGRDVGLRRLALRVAGLRAIRASGVGHVVEDCDIADVGQGGISLWGGDRRTLTPAGLTARGNRISRFSRWVHTYRPAIQMGGVGNVAQGNLITDGPHAGIVHYGNDHLIEFNHLASLATETGDVGAIYTGMDWAARGTTIRHNVLQDIQGPGLHGSRGVYLDDQASGITVQGNVFVRVDQAVFIGGGRDNLVDGNLFVASSPAIHLDDRGLSWQKALTDDPDGPLRKRLREVPYRGDAYLRYPGLARLLETEPGRPLGNVARRNAVVDGRPFDFQGSAQRDLQVDRVFGADLLRFGPGPALARRDLRQLEPGEDSPALREGFPALPWARMRCTRARWEGVAPGGQPRTDVADCAAQAAR